MGSLEKKTFMNGAPQQHVHRGFSEATISAHIAQKRNELRRRKDDIMTWLKSAIEIYDIIKVGNYSIYRYMSFSALLINILNGRIEIKHNIDKNILDISFSFISCCNEHDISNDLHFSLPSVSNYSRVSIMKQLHSIMEYPITVFTERWSKSLLIPLHIKSGDEHSMLISAAELSLGNEYYNFEDVGKNVEYNKKLCKEFSCLKLNSYHIIGRIRKMIRVLEAPTVRLFNSARLIAVSELLIIRGMEVYFPADIASIIFEYYCEL